MVFIRRRTVNRILAYGENSHTLAKYVVLMVVFLSIILPSFASDMTTHYIIAFDLCLPEVYKSEYEKRDNLKLVDNMLAGNFNPETDYISVVSYSLLFSDPSMEHFVRPYRNPSDSIDMLWYKKGNDTLYDIFSDWPQIKGGNGGSLQSFAKPYVVMATKNDSLCADRTIIILVTDFVNNGADDNYYNQWNDLCHAAATPASASRVMEEEEKDVVSTAQRFNKHFSFDDAPFGRDTINEQGEKPYQIVSYEVVAASKPHFLGVTEMPSPTPLVRVHGGYKIQADVHSRNGYDQYEIREILITKEESVIDTLVYNTDGKIDAFISSDKLSVGDSLTTSMSLAFKDGLYNGCLISYRNPEYRAGMSIKQKVKLDDKSKVLGLLPLADFFWWWYPDDVVKAVMVWGVIILLILIIVVVFLFYRLFVWINAYTPKDDDIKIEKI